MCVTLFCEVTYTVLFQIMEVAAEAAEDQSVGFETGEKLWIKLPGYPPWPGRIEEPRNLRERKKVKPGFWLVFFYGTHETAVAARHELFKWTEENNKQWFIERDTVYFTDSLWEVENDPNVKRDAPLPAITKPPDLDNVTKYNPIVPPTFSDGEEPLEEDTRESSSDSQSDSKDSDSSPSSSSSSDSEYEKKKKQRKKVQVKKKQQKESKTKQANSKQRKRKASSSDSSVVDDVDVSSSSSDDDAISKLPKLASVSKVVPRTTAAFIPKPTINSSDKEKSSKKESSKKPAKVSSLV